MAKKTMIVDPDSEIEAPDPSSKLTREQLEGYLWAAADILRESTRSST